MAGRWFAKWVPRRAAPPLTRKALSRMARNPSIHAPFAEEILQPERFEPLAPPRVSAQEQALLEAIFRDPESDEPRLRYAEWCTTHGDPRGEFIRLQIDHAKSSHPGVKVRAEPREHELLTKHASQWTAAFEPWSARDFVFHRGFVEGLSLSGRAFISLSDTLFRLAPLQSVRLVAIAPFMNELADTQNLSKVKHLDLTGNWIGPTGLECLAASSNLGRLQQLNLRRNGLGATGLLALLKAPWLGQITAVSLADNQMTVEQVRALFSQQQATRIVDLDVSDQELGRELIDVLEETRFFHRCERLAMENIGLGQEGAKRLARVGQGPVALDLGFNFIQNDGAFALGESAVFREVRDLSLRGNRLTDLCIPALMQFPWHEKLSNLDLSANYFSEPGKSRLLERFGSIVRV